MSAAIIAQLGLDRSKFRTEAEAAKGDLTRMAAEAKQTAAAIASLERALKGVGGGSSAQRDQLKGLRETLRDTRRDIRATETQLRALEAGAVGGAAAPGEGGHANGANNAYARRQELGHSARAFMDSLLAGANPTQAAEMQAPRILQAFGGGLGQLVGIGA